VVTVCAQWLQCVPSGYSVCPVVTVCAEWLQCVPSGYSVCPVRNLLGSTIQNDVLIWLIEGVG